MDNPKISIITPSYNQAEFLERNLQSVRDQSYDDIEHIVVDGGSEDGTVNLLKKYESQYDLRWVSEQDRGQSHAVNKGIKMANGEWLGWQNSDDYYSSGAFKTVVEKEQTHPDAQVIYGDTLIVDQSGKEVSRTFHTRPSKFVQRYWSLFAGNQSLFVKRGVMDEIGGLDESLYYTMDAKLTWEILNRDYQFVCVHKPLGAFRIQEGAKTFGDIRNEQQQELEKIYSHPQYERYVPDVILSEVAKVLKLLYLIRDGRYEAIAYNINSRLTV